MYYRVQNYDYFLKYLPKNKFICLIWTANEADKSEMGQKRGIYFLSFEDHVAQCDETFSTEIHTFKDGNDVIEHFEIDGKRLINIIPLVKDCEAV